MKTKIYILIILIVIALIASFFIFKKNQSPQLSSLTLWPNYQIIKKNIDGKELKLVVADTPERREKGLMFVRKPTDFDGMIFIFEDKDLRTFWNMNTFENLTLYWMNDNVVTGTSNLPSIEQSKEIVRVSSQKPVNIVVEVIK